LVKKEKPEFIVVLGDLLHTHERLHTIALNKAYEFIKSLREFAPVFVIVGNHDYIQNQQFLTQNHWMNGMKEWEGVKIVDEVVFFEDFVFCPYVPNGRFEEALNTSKKDWKKSRCIFAHQEFFGCKMGAIVSVEGDKWGEEHPFVVSGHIHSKQWPQKNVYYTGSAMQHAFGESEDTTIAVFDFLEERYELREVDLGLKHKKIVYLDMEKADSFEYKGDDEVKLTIRGNYDEFKAFKKGEKYKSLVKSGVKVAFKIDKETEKEKIENRVANSEENSFTQILQNISYSSENKEIFRIYELLVNNNDVLVM
jgi:DNA repair exonuclease SbcCD nuclease subunit